MYTYVYIYIYIIYIYIHIICIYIYIYICRERSIDWISHYITLYIMKSYYLVLAPGRVVAVGASGHFSFSL